jgi:protein-disulfide isomerase
MSLKPAVSIKDHVQGNPSAPIELVEYGDFQCSFCGNAYRMVKELQQSFGPHLKFVYRHFPLSQVHPEARLAAIAAEAAARQGKFWEMHDILFENQRWLYGSGLMKYADRIGLDLNQFEHDLFSKTMAMKVQHDFESGVRSGINRTPGFFVNGKIYNDNWEHNLANYIQGQLDSLAAV